MTEFPSEASAGAGVSTSEDVAVSEDVVVQSPFPPIQPPPRAVVFADDGCSVECVDSTTAVQYSITDVYGERPSILTFRTQRDGDGLTNEAVLAMLEYRLGALNAKKPCRENALAITKLQEARLWLEERDRRVRQEQHA